MFIEIVNAENKQPKNARLQSAVGGGEVDSCCIPSRVAVTAGATTRPRVATSRV